MTNGGRLLRCEPAEEGGDARRSYGYFKYLESKLRNHILFETARAALLKHDLSDAAALLDEALVERRDLERFMEAGGLGGGHCDTLQRLTPAARPPGSEGIVVTASSAERDTAMFKSTLGLLALAQAAHGQGEAGFESAVALFDDALANGEFANDTTLAQTTKRYRREARKALALE